MSHKLMDEFYWCDIDEQKAEQLTDSEKYQLAVDWAAKARGQNPNAFDRLTEWVLDDSNWEDSAFSSSRELLMDGVLKRFREQNAFLRSYLLALKSSGVVNETVFSALDRFDDELTGAVHDQALRQDVSRVFSDLTAMRERSVRETIAGNKTGPAGTGHVEIFGYLNYLKDCDAAVQWALFMPDVVKNQQKGFQMDSLEYRKMPAMRFIGQEGEGLSDIAQRRKLFSVLDAMEEYRSGFDYDVLLMHHYGKTVDVGPWHGVWGRFMKAGTPVPEGFLHFDFVPYHDGKAGPPYLSQFAYAVFSGDLDAMHGRKGYDSDAMYDVTRNTMLAQGMPIPYPDKYWTGEVFLNGHDGDSTAYLFSAEL